MDKTLVLRYQGLLKIHPEIVACGILPHIASLGLDPGQLADIVQDTDWYTPSENGSFEVVSLNRYSYVNGIFIAGKLASPTDFVSYADAEAEVKAKAKEKGFRLLYRAFLLLLKDGKQEEIYYLMGVAEELPS